MSLNEYIEQHGCPECGGKIATFYVNHITETQIFVRTLCETPCAKYFPIDRNGISLETVHPIYQHLFSDIPEVDNKLRKQKDSTLHSFLSKD